jgi:hypothetical protein
MVDTPKKPNPLGLMDDEDRDESIINDIFVTDKDWEDWEKVKKEGEARRAAQERRDAHGSDDGSAP